MQILRYFFLVASLFLLGCPSSAQPGLTPVLVESKRSVPLQQCQATPRFRSLVDQSVVAMLDELSTIGVINREGMIKSLKDEPPIACMINQPEPCMLTPASCRKDPTNIRCARKRGCGHEAFFWVAEVWPPVCKPEWPDEPHCVASADQQTNDGFINDLVHEVCEMLCARRFPPCNAHNVRELEAQKRAAAKLK